VLDLRREEKFRPVEHAPKELVQALADLLLEALGKQNKAVTVWREACDVSEDHA
jgi:phenylpyruvate tautomerase PptA (4-oxalocrotonate tautomerase family)